MQRRNKFRIAFYLPAIFILALLFPRLQKKYGEFEPPADTQVLSAIDLSADLSPTLRKALQPGSHFQRLGQPGIRDWLYDMGRSDRQGQTFKQWEKSRRNLITENRRTLYFQRWDAEEPNPLLTSASQEILSIFFQLPLKECATVDPTKRNIKIRSTRGIDQLLAPDILRDMATEVPVDAYAVIALSSQDLYPEEDWGFVFGLASIRERVGIFSYNRFNNFAESSNQAVLSRSERKALLRSLKVLTHETSHMLGIHHCIYYKCNMNGVSGLAELDATPIHLCPVCLRKVQHATGLDVHRRYEELAAFYQKHGLTEQAEWVTARHRNLTAQ